MPGHISDAVNRHVRSGGTEASPAIVHRRLGIDVQAEILCRPGQVFDVLERTYSLDTGRWRFELQEVVR